MSADRSLFRDLFVSGMRQFGFIHRLEVKESFVARSELEREYQPIPLHWWVSRVASGNVSIITRAWTTDDVGFCGLCEGHGCRAKEVGVSSGISVCVIQASKIVSNSEAPFFTLPPPDAPAK